MNSDFWALIEGARPPDGDPSRHAADLTERLARRGVDDVRAFGADFDAAMDALYHWDLWGAAYLALGGSRRRRSWARSWTTLRHGPG